MYISGVGLENLENYYRKIVDSLPVPSRKLRNLEDARKEIRRIFGCITEDLEIVAYFYFEAYHPSICNSL